MLKIVYDSSQYYDERYSSDAQADRRWHNSCLIILSQRLALTPRSNHSNDAAFFSTPL